MMASYTRSSPVLCAHTLTLWSAGLFFLLAVRYRCVMVCSVFSRSVGVFIASRVFVCMIGMCKIQ